MLSNYTVPAGTRIGHIHLKVSDLQRSLEFFCGLLGFEFITLLDSRKAFRVWCVNSIKGLFS
jgi:catechol 2,3-dioxygenase